MDIGKLKYSKNSTYRFGRSKTNEVSSKHLQSPSRRNSDFKLDKSVESSLGANSIYNGSNNSNDNINKSTPETVENFSSIATSTPSVPVASASIDNVSKVTKSRRNVTSLRSSLRRLITITFNCGSSSSNAQIINNNTTTNNHNNSSNKSDSSAKLSKEMQSSRLSSKQRDKSTLQQTNKKRNSYTSFTPRAIPASRSVHNIFTPNQTSLGSKKMSNPTIIEGKMPLSQATINSKNSGSQRNINFISSDGDSSNGNSSNSNSRRQTISESDIITKDLSTNQSTASTPLPSASTYTQNSENSSASRQSTEINSKNWIECPVCVLLVTESSALNLEGCRHRVCLECMQRYITTEINHSRLNITCPICSEPIHPNTIKQILQNEKYYSKYENFMLRRVLAADSDARWCPAPDCGYVVLANGCASCPKLVCGREGCNTSFCYHCKQEWHPNQTCSAASIQRNQRSAGVFSVSSRVEDPTQNRKSSKSSQTPGTVQADDIKECPVCASRIIKMNDGSCNHMTCSICETEFCWLCMKEISDLHYFSPSGCTFWGKKPWSKKKKLLWQLGILIGAPVCIILIAGIAVPAIVIGIPVWAARKLHERLEGKQFSRYRKNAILTGGVLLSFVVSPIISAVALAIGIPILLCYVYGVVPLSLCRSSGGCLSPANSMENLQQQNRSSRISSNLQVREDVSLDTVLGHKSGETSSNMSLETNSIGHVTIVEREDRESASNAGLAGSIISNAAEDGNSTCALAGSIISKESGYTLISGDHRENLFLN